MHSEGNGQRAFRLLLDGPYHSVLALTGWPRRPIRHHPRLTKPAASGLTSRATLTRCPHEGNHKEAKENDRVAGDYAAKEILVLT